MRGAQCASMNSQVIIAGGGIGGLACALALSRAGQPVQVLEQASRLSEVGAGIQLGPNAVRVLHDWGLADALAGCAAFPDHLAVRDARSGKTLGQLRLGAAAQARYGKPYATIHRADLHNLLLQALADRANASIALDARVSSYEEASDGVALHCEDDRSFEGEALIGADGLWSRVRQQLLGAQASRASGHLAYRALVNPATLQPAMRRPVVTAWLGPKLHVVHYPVRRGEVFNLVAVVEGVIGMGHGGHVDGDPQSWTHEAHAADLRRTLGPVCPDLMTMIDAAQEWKLWALNDRPPVAGAHEHARGRVALLGDAAHPLRPYLAQGAAMAIEDAWTLGQLRADVPTGPVDWPALFGRYARTRWQRNARVQARSERNGRIFHADGVVRLGRNAAMAMLGESLLDQPWLYSGPPAPVL